MSAKQRLTVRMFERWLEDARAKDEAMLGRAWDYSVARWAWHMAKFAEAHEWQDDMTCSCHGYTPDDIMRLVV